MTNFIQRWTTRPTHAVALATLSFSFFSPTLHAQTADNPQSVLVTAARQVQAAKDVLADNVVLSAADIASSGATDLLDLLQKQRGIEITRTGGAGTVASLFLRGGANAQNVVLVDGIRIGSSTSGGATWSAIPLSEIERVEIVYGPLSSLYGADALGGVVQIFTKKGGKDLALQTSLATGSYQLRQFNLGVSGQIVDGLRFSLHASTEKNKGFSATRTGNFSYNPDDDGYQQSSVSGNLVWQASKDLELGFNFLESYLKNQFDAGSFYDDRATQRLETRAIFAKFQVNPFWSSRVQASQALDRGSSNAYYGSSFSDPFLFYDDSRFTTKQETLSWQNDVKIGTDVLQIFAETRDEKVSTSTEELNGKRSTNSLAASYVFKQDAHLANASLRYDHSSQYNGKVTGNLAYGFRLNQALRVNASLGTSFRAPTFNELYFPFFGIASNRPERGRNGEIGFAYDDGAAQWNASYYNTKVTDLIVSTSVCPILQAERPFGCAYNVNRATLAGFTAGGSVKFDRFTLRAALDLQNPKDDTTDTQLARRAKQHANLALDYRFDQLKLSIESRATGKRYDDAANKNRLAGYALLDVSAELKLAHDLSLIGRWNNVFDRDYELIKTYNTPGSNVFVGLRYQN